MARRDYFYDLEAPKPNSIRPATAVALFNSNGELLLFHRKDNDKWTMPGGTLDFGESLTHATPESDRGKFSMIGSSDRRLSSLSGPNANRFLDRHNKNPAVIQSSCSGLTYNGLNRTPNTIIRDNGMRILDQSLKNRFATRMNRRNVGRARSENSDQKAVDLLLRYRLKAKSCGSL